MPIKLQGFVLIIVLVFLSLFAMLSFYSLETNILEKNIATHYWRRMMLSVITENILRSIEKKVIKNPVPCKIAITPTHEKMQQTIDWWQHNSCVGNSQRLQYYYVVEALGQNPCSYIEQETEGSMKKTIVNRFRVTLLVTNKENIQEKMLVQSVVNKPSNRIASCKSKPYLFKLGRQSWRELI